MIACLDVGYEDTAAHAAGVISMDWADAVTVTENVVVIPHVEPYQSGEFFRRELPCLLAVLNVLPKPETVVIDGYVWLNVAGKPGLGAYLYRELGERVPVIGVAKTKFEGAHAEEVLRGKSDRPLFVTSVGMEAETAAMCIRSMHGNNRIPTLLKRVDWLCRRARTGGLKNPPSHLGMRGTS
jgi:deoxyribonuclease V